MGYLRELVAIQEPFPYEVVGNERTHWTCNYHFTYRDVGGPSYPETVFAAFIVSGALGVLGTDLFIGPRAVFPEGSGPFTRVMNTGGMLPEHTHNGSVTKRGSVQVVVVSDQYESGRARAHAIYDYVNGIRNQSI